MELAVLSAKVHGHGTDVQLAARTASAALVAAAAVDTGRAKSYIDLIFTALSQDAREALKTMNSLGHEYASDFARHYVNEGRLEGRAEGRIEGRAEVVLELLALRFGPLEEKVRTQVRNAAPEQLRALTARVVTARTLSEVMEILL